MDKDPSKGRLSKEAWIAAGATLVAALIGGVVTLWTHLTPPAQSSPAPASAIANTAKTDTESSSTPDIVVSTISAMAGKWKGTARDSSGTTFQITLEVTDKCAPGQLCGSISVPHVPCYGQIFLGSMDNGDVEFRVDNFDDRSNRQKCQPGAGEHFRLQSDGKLAYHTTYDPVAQGTLTRD